MELKILFLSLLPTIALAGALAAGTVDDEPRTHGAETTARAGKTTRVGTTVVAPARPADASLAALEARSP